MQQRITGLLFASVAILMSASAQAADKSQYNLFNPTPKDQMRELSTDRPDKTESPYTVDAGHFQIEADFVNYTFDKYKSGGENLRSKTWNVAPINLKAGLTDSTDLQIVLDDYVRQTVSDKHAGTRERADGFGDVTVRLKQNIWGNDGGKTALAIMPYVKIPTNQDDLGNDDVEGGVIVPLAIDLGDGYGLGLMTQVDVLKDGDDHGYHPAFVNSATFAVEWTDKVGSYYELYTEKGTDGGDKWIVSFDTGVTYGLTDNIQLDAGINLGITEMADDYQPFIGISYRY